MPLMEQSVSGIYHSLPPLYLLFSIFYFLFLIFYFSILFVVVHQAKACQFSLHFCHLPITNIG